MKLDKGNHAWLLTEQVTGQRTLPSTEHELKTQLESIAAREIKRQQVAAELAADKAATDHVEADRAAHEAMMAAHLGQQAMAPALAAGATNEEAIAVGMAASITTWREEDEEHMQD